MRTNNLREHTTQSTLTQFEMLSFDKYANVEALEESSDLPPTTYGLVRIMKFCLKMVLSLLRNGW